MSAYYFPFAVTFIENYKILFDSIKYDVYALSYISTHIEYTIEHVKGKRFMRVRHIRIDDKLWAKLEKKSAPEKVSGLIRTILRDFFEKTPDRSRTSDLKINKGELK